MSEKDPSASAYRLDVKKYEQIYYRSIPLTCVRSVELNVMTGTVAETKLSMREPLCCGICRCFGVSCIFYLPTHLNTVVGLTESLLNKDIVISVYNKSGHDKKCTD